MYEVGTKTIRKSSEYKSKGKFRKIDNFFGYTSTYKVKYKKSLKPKSKILSNPKINSKKNIFFFLSIIAYLLRKNNLLMLRCCKRSITPITTEVNYKKICKYGKFYLQNLWNIKFIYPLIYCTFSKTFLGRSKYVPIPI